MEVSVLRSTLIKPCLSRAKQKVSSKIPLTIFDVAMSDFFIAIILAFSPPAPSNEAMKTSLAKLLASYPRLAGKLSVDQHGRPCIELDQDAGVPVTETRIAGRLADNLPIEPTPELTKLHPETDGLDHVLTIQLNRFDCDGLIIGLASNHRVADGCSMGKFLASWGRVVRGLEIDPVPVDDHHSLLVPRDPPVCEFPHRVLEFADQTRAETKWIDPESVKNVSVHYGEEFLSQLKESAGYGGHGAKLSTFQCLLAHMWRKVTIARGLGEMETTHVRVLVNGRPRLMVVDEYFGNLVLCAYPTATVKDLLQKDGLGHAARLIREAVRQIGKKYFQSFIDFGVVNQEKALSPESDMDGNCLSPHLEVDSWLGLEFDSMDIGGGGLCAFLPTWIPEEGILVFVPSICKDRGERGITVRVTLLHDHAMTFKKIAYSLD